uniref:Uncharacterized protein n=1 Tax=Arundo donax TaxID=35708 RepID=A0A0A9FZ59_ARUDO
MCSITRITTNLPWARSTQLETSLQRYPRTT